MESYEKVKQERESAERSWDLLTVDLERVTHDAKVLWVGNGWHNVFLRNGEHSLIEYFYMGFYTYLLI
jgi:hypothetical protein